MTSNLNLRNVSIAAVSLVIFAAGMEVRPAAAQDNHGAIAFSQRTGAVGWSYDFPTRAAAEQRALQECGQHGGGCRITTWFRNACGALAVGDGNGWGGSWGNTRHEAESKALSLCSNETRRCTVRRWVCTTR